MKTKYLGLTVLLLCLFFGGSGFGVQLITVVNPSFELDLTGQPNQTKRDLGEVLGWLEGVDNGSGVEQIAEPGKAFTGTGDGYMKAYGVWDGDGTYTGDWWYQILDHQIVAGEEYQMTFAYGVNSASTPIIASFIDGDTMAELASVTVNTATRFVFVDYVLNMTVPVDASYAGHHLGVKFRVGQKTANPQYDGWASVDNVRVQIGHNNAPQVSAGEDATITLPTNAVALDGTVSDDGEPFPPGAISVLWEKVSGPESYVIAEPYSVDTAVTFSSSGCYTFRLTASDGLLNASDEMKVTVYLPGGVMTNEGDYPNNEIPIYRKFEATLNVQTVAENLQLPYDANPPAGLAPGLGVSVDVLFSPDNWTTTYKQPAFYYKDMEYKAIGNQDWWYPTGDYFWKARFSPDKVAVWKYKYVVQDASGTTESIEREFVACESSEKGFIRVSQKDKRYFEYDNGEYFIGLGHNLRFGQLSWANPIKANTALFQTLHDNGTQLFRSWLSHWCIYGSVWSPWTSPLAAKHTLDPPWTGLSVWNVDPNSEVCLRLSWPESPAMFRGWSTSKELPVKRNTNYRFSVRYHTPLGVVGPRIAGHPYGVVLKVSDSWLDPDNNNVYNYCDPGTGTVVTDYGWQGGQYMTVEGTWNSGNRDFLPYVYVVLENVNSVEQGLQVDRIEIREDLGNGEYGPCILGKSWFAYHYYMDQHKAWAFDKVIELAEEYDIYLKLVLMEKQDWIMCHITPAGDITDSESANYFYGQYRTIDKGRWLQQAWWRYCQARWGYSPHIHSWEACNEADPGSYRHYAQVDEMGKYMSQFGNKHLSSTSFWSGFPKDQFWANTAYPYVDYADLHLYALGTEDCAEATRAPSENRGAYQPNGAGKPLIRGETGFFDEGTVRDSNGIWMHNFAWGQINHGGMYDLYWDNINEFNDNPDPRAHFRPLRDFLNGIPLNNGCYEALSPTIGGSNIRVFGQKDLVNERAHLWIQNDQHTWYNIVNSNPIPPVSGTVEFAGFRANKKYRVEWFDTYTAASRTAVFEDGDFVLPWLSATTGGSYSDLPFEASIAPDGSGAAYADIWPGNGGLWTKISNSGSKDIGGNRYLEFDIYFDTASSPGHKLAAMHMDVNGDGGWNYKWENTSRCWVDGVLTDMDDGIPGNDLPMTGNQWHHFRLDLLDNVSPTVPFGGPIPLPENPAIGTIRLYFAGVTDGADVYIRNMCFSNGSDSDGVITSTEYLTADGAGSLTLSVTNLSTDTAVKVTGIHGDLTNDMYVDYDDLSILADNWLGSGAGGGDIAPPDSPDGIVNLLDFAKLAERWLEGI